MLLGALIGATGIALGAIQWSFYETPRPPDYHYPFLIAGAGILALAVGGFAIPRTNWLKTDPQRRDAIYAIAALVVVGLAVAAWILRAVDIPGLG